MTFSKKKDHTSLIPPSDLGEALYPLYGIGPGRIDTTIFFHGIADEYKFTWTGQEVKERISSLEWALQNRAYDFNSVLPDLGFSNTEILYYVEKYLRIIKPSFDEEVLNKMMVPHDERNLNIFFINYSPPITDFNVLSFGYQKYRRIVMLTDYDIETLTTAYSQESFDIVILCHKTISKISDYLITINNIDKKRSAHLPPVLVLLNSENDAEIDKLYELGCSKHFLLPTPRYIILQEIYKLTTEN